MKAAVPLTLVSLVMDEGKLRLVGSLVQISASSFLQCCDAYLQKFASGLNK